ncbi:hypothetical protein AHF37_05582 [Paragonimus kellicotti]|nr:hypothetical protein AHF37_05582 [Paragonimus kellicotti]
MTTFYADDLTDGQGGLVFFRILKRMIASELIESPLEVDRRFDRRCKMERQPVQTGMDRSAHLHIGILRIKLILSVCHE